ncbi:cytochrome P450 [Kitasatospora sp. NPDC048540]|uniref:cytochrome P450 n=1 Tax=unclassified Kitasatospora TaxID=2633591 RepID=UPI00068E4BF7|nr:cytochrome P450 [Kitasatospora sp. MBT63]
MTSPVPADHALTPPPGCPAHGLGPDGIRRLYGPEAEADPSGLYEKLRAEHGPVAPVLLHGDLPAWLVLGHRENLDVARTPSRFSRDSRRWTAFQHNQVAPDSPLLPMVGWQPLCVFADGAEHKRLRGAVTDSLEMFDRRGVRRHVTRFAGQLIDGFAAAGTADLVSQFAEHLPMLVMTQLLGMPEEYGPRLVEAARDLMKGTETAVASNEYVVATLRQLVQRKHTAPGADLPSWLLHHEAGLDDEEVMEHLRLILVAANETTVNLIADTLRMVLTDRRFRANLSGGHMTLPDALDQVLWDSPPLSAVPGRWATGDTELGGRRIRAGDMLLLGLAAGNVDPQIRPDLDEPLYGNRSHLAFSSGPHECPGQDVGRAIAEAGIDTLLARLPDLRLAVSEDELRWNSAWLSRHLAELPVEFTARRPKAATAAPLVEPATVPAPGAPTGRRQPEGRLEGQFEASFEAQPMTDDRATAPQEPRRHWWSVLTARLRGR